MAVSARACAALALAAILTHGAELPVIEVGKFSAAQPNGQWPVGWELQAFAPIERHTTYGLADDGGVTVLRAESVAAAAGLVRKLEVDAGRYPILAWRWKIAHLLEKSDPARRAGDDYPARVYVTFKFDPSRVSALRRAEYALARIAYGEYPPHASLAYVWDRRLALGTMLPNAYSDRVRMIVVRTGMADVGHWVAEERDVYADYWHAFGEEPPAISGVAVMTDTDDTGERATAWYGDIVLRRRQ